MSYLLREDEAEENNLESRLLKISVTSCLTIFRKFPLCIGGFIYK